MTGDTYGRGGSAGATAGAATGGAAETGAGGDTNGPLGRGVGADGVGLGGSGAGAPNEGRANGDVTGARGGGDEGCAGVNTGAAGGMAGVATAPGAGLTPTTASAASGDTANTLPHTAQRARTPADGSLAGSTRYTVSHDVQVTFTATTSRSFSRLVPRPGRDRGAGRRRTPTPAGSWRSSSFP